MIGLRAIETQYKGYRFRSRLEARWAVFFDVLKIKWDYELEGYDLGAFGTYLPDFWLPQVSMFAEVKPAIFTPSELAKSKALAELTGYPCLLLDGSPALRSYWAVHPQSPDYPSFVDYVLFEPHRYWECEGRFYCCLDGAEYPDVDVYDLRDAQLGAGAVVAARSARFGSREMASLKPPRPRLGWGMSGSAS